MKKKIAFYPAEVTFLDKPLLSYHHKINQLSGKKLAGDPGFEPGLTESESAVLPLD